MVRREARGEVARNERARITLSPIKISEGINGYTSTYTSIRAVGARANEFYETREGKESSLVAF